MFSQNRRRLNRVLEVLRDEGIAGVYQRIRTRRHSHVASTAISNPTAGAEYPEWIKQVEANQSPPKTEANRSLSIVMPVYQPDLTFLQEAIDSVLAQTYQSWELCIHDDGSGDLDLTKLLGANGNKDPRIKMTQSVENAGIAAASNSAADLATGDFIVLMDQDDLLSPEALQYLASTIEKNQSLRLIYSDEDKLDAKGNRVTPYFKPDYNYQLLLSQNYLCHLVAVYRQTFKEVRGFLPDYEGAQDHDLMLRLIETIDPNEIHHIPAVLYHWRVHDGSTASDISSKPNALEAGRSAVSAHLDRIGSKATVNLNQIRYRVKYQLPDQNSVTIVIPTRNGFATLERCINSIREKTNYPNFRLLVIDNGSDDFTTLNYLKSLSKNGVKVLVENQPFNFAALNNLAIEQTDTEFVCLLNDDTEVISSDWLEELVGHCAQKNVGAVGAKLLYPNETIQHAGVVLGIGGVAGHSHKHLDRHDDGYFGRLQVSQNYSAVTAACLLTRRSIWQEVSGMDEQLTVAFNDIDFCLKLGDAGYSVVWTPWAELYHHESVSRGYETTPEKQERFRQEIGHMMSKWTDHLSNDPHYSPHLTLLSEQFQIRRAAEY
jgi:glycosyltransferase involved in cell wall biosynthesis